MPNHCHNDLYVDGPKEDVDALLRLVGSDREAPEFNCGAVIPYPEHWAKLDKDMAELGWKGFEDRYGKGAKDGFNSGGYEWRIKNWGTKWGAYNVKRRDYGGVCVTFQSAWSAPAPVIEALHKLFPKCSLHLEWFERGMEKCGGFSCVSEDAWWDESDAWAPETIYPAHAHPAVELYHVVSGTALWTAGDILRRRVPGDFILHPSGVRHATRTQAQPLLAIYTWTGEVGTASRFVE